MNYHVVPDLTPKEKADVKIVAIRLGISAKELVKRAIISYMARQEIKYVLEENK